MMILINPGTEPVEGASKKHAAENMAHLLTDIGSKHDIKMFHNPDGDYGGGRFCFVLCDYDNNTFHEIQMPGLPLNRVRYTEDSEQNIFDFSRLYIDDGSWIWFIAVNILKREFSKERDENE